MKIIDRLNRAHEEGRVCWSFEYFPPKTDQGVQNLFERMERMYLLGPEFVDVTWGAGGSTADTTLEICTFASTFGGLETCMHLTCTNMPRDKIDHALKVCQQAGIHNILALRGDPPRGQEKWEAVEGGFANAVDLVRYIRKEYGDYFGIGVAGYPEGHTDNPDKELDLKYLKDKVDAGADYVITQLFYDMDIYFAWEKRCREIGITVPILPGLMPIHTYAGWKRIVTLSKTIVPKKIEDELELIKDDDQAAKDYGVKLLVDMVRQMMEHGIRDFHFYTLNLEKSVRLILEELNFVPEHGRIKPLPWKPSLGKRSNENVRPIFWALRPKSYVSRTESWDDFPNGRWGDSRSPAYGEIDGYGVSLKYSGEEAVQKWGRPESVEDVLQLFVNYLKGTLDSLPWCDSLAGESSIINEQLVAVNRAGFLTINSQPAINGAKSSDPVVGWGGDGGYVYQKAYLEFFVSREGFERLLPMLSDPNRFSYYCVDVKGNLRTNYKRDVATAVTWGVFPGCEILQPTIVERESFLAWKDEAFALWHQWALLHEAGSVTAKLLEDIRNTWLLVNIVENDYVNSNVFSPFSTANDAQGK